MIDAVDLPVAASVELPEAWRRTPTGESMPNVVDAVRLARRVRDVIDVRMPADL